MHGWSCYRLQVGIRSITPLKSKCNIPFLWYKRDIKVPSKYTRNFLQSPFHLCRRKSSFHHKKLKVVVVDLMCCTIRWIICTCGPDWIIEYGVLNSEPSRSQGIIAANVICQTILYNLF